MKQLLKWADRAFSLLVGGILLYMLLTKFVLPMRSAPVDPSWKLPPGRPSLVEFSSSHCPSCLAMRPVLGQIKRKYEGKIAFRTFAFDSLSDSERYEAQRLASEFGVRVTPTFVISGSDGKVTARFLGPTSYLSLAQALDQVIKQKESL